MPRKSMYTRTEQEHGKPMADILLPMLNTHGEEKTADLLHVNQSTVWAWTRRAGLRYVCRWERAAAPQSQGGAE